MSSSKTRLVLIIVVIGAGIYGFINHQEHLEPYLPFAFLLGCLVMHLCMHGHHKHHASHENEKHE